VQAEKDEMQLIKEKRGGTLGISSRWGGGIQKGGKTCDGRGSPPPCEGGRLSGVMKVEKKPLGTAPSIMRDLAGRLWKSGARRRAENSEGLSLLGGVNTGMGFTQKSAS